MATIQILGIPDEIIVDIVKQLKGKEIKTVRATCKKLNRIASPYLFPVLYLSCHQLDLDVFRLVASNPLLIGGVRELVIDDATIPTTIFGKATKAAPCAFSVDQEMNNLIKKLNYRVFKGHRDNRVAEADIHALKEAIPHFKALRSLVVTSRAPLERHISGSQSHDNSSPAHKMWKRTAHAFKLSMPSEDVAFTPRREWATTSEFKDQDGEWFTNTMGWMDDRFGENTMGDGKPGSKGRFYEYRSTGRGHRRNKQTTISWKSRVIFIALHILEDPRLSSQLTEFRVDESDDLLVESREPGLDITLFDKRSPFPERLVKGFLETQNLTKFRLVLSSQYIREEGEETVKEGRLGMIFAAMPQLENLYFEPHGMSTVAAIPSNLTFHRLRTVFFSCGDIDSRSLIEFLQRHSPTLKRLSIAYCNIDPTRHGANWDDVVNQMTTMMKQGIIKLDEAYIHYVIDSDVILACGKSVSLEYARESITDEDIYSWRYQHGAWTERTSLAEGSSDGYGDESGEEYYDGFDDGLIKLIHGWEFLSTDVR
ncbi:hypothetical protein ACHAP5_005126 [Fusarium lateritium]